MTVTPPRLVSHPSPNRGGYSRTRRVDALVWHVTAGSFQPSLDWLCNPASSASANYLIDKDGTIYELVPYTEDAWTNGIADHPDIASPLINRWLAEGVNFNQRTIGIETVRETSANEHPGGFTPAQHASLVQLSAWLCQACHLPADRGHILRHAQIDSVNRPHCPGLAEAEMVAWIAEIAHLVDPAAPSSFAHAPGWLDPLIDRFDWTQDGTPGAGIVTYRKIIAYNDQTRVYYSREWDNKTGLTPFVQLP